MQSSTAQKGRIQQKASVFQAKPSQFRVIARPPCGRGNLKAEGMASRSEARERKTTKSPNFESSRSDTTTALPRKRHFTRAQARISHAQHISHDQRSYFTAQRWPCLVPGCRFVPPKIAASGIENALLAMTESVGFSEKRDSFQNEMFEKRCGAAPRKNDRIQQKASVFQTKPSQFRVIARSAATWQS